MLISLYTYTDIELRKMEDMKENTNFGCCGWLFGSMGHRLERIRRRLRKRLKGKQTLYKPQERTYSSNPGPEPNNVVSRTSKAAPEPHTVASRTSIAPPEPPTVLSRTLIAPPEPHKVLSRTSIAPPEPHKVASRISIAPPEPQRVPSYCSSIFSTGGEGPETSFTCTGYTYIRDSSSEDSIVSSSQIYAGLIYRGDSDDSDEEEDPGAFFSFFGDDNDVGGYLNNGNNYQTDVFVC